MRTAMDTAIVEGAFAALRDAPRAALETVQQAVRAVRDDDLEERGPIERATDALLDRLADAPDEVLARLYDAFDTALAKGAP